MSEYDAIEIIENSPPENKRKLEELLKDQKNQCHGCFVKDELKTIKNGNNKRFSVCVCVCV